jgi:hypothetical protein
LVDSAEYGAQIETAPEDEVINWAHSLMARHLRPDGMDEASVPKPQGIRTAWSSDPYSFGSYAYIPVQDASNGEETCTPTDISQFAVPIWSDRLGFAGEHVSVTLIAVFATSNPS